MRRSLQFLFRIKGLLLITIFWGLLFSIMRHEKRWDWRPIIESDVCGYYSYLPSLFIYKDLHFNYYHDSLLVKNRSQYTPMVNPEGKKFIKYTMGLSYMYAPFFLGATWYAKVYGYPIDGFSFPYQYFIHFAGWFYLLFGLFALYRFLLFYFSEKVSLLTILFVLFSTNLFYYVTGESGFPHSYNFTLFSILLCYTKLLLEKCNAWRLIVVLATASLLILIRPINIFVVFVPLLLEVKNSYDFKQRIQLFLNKWWKITLLVLVPFIVFFPQFLYWKLCTGHWILYSYTNESFDFTNPELLNGFFSYRKGWFVYSPIWLCIFPGFYLLYRKQKHLSIFIFLFFCVYSYVIFSWWCWFYGGSFGCRALVDIYPLLAIVMAAFLEKLIHTHWTLKLFSGVLLYLTIKLNLFQTEQYKANTMHWSSMDKETYWVIWNKLSLTPEERAKVEGIWCCNYENSK